MWGWFYWDWWQMMVRALWDPAQGRYVDMRVLVHRHCDPQKPPFPGRGGAPGYGQR